MFNSDFFLHAAGGVVLKSPRFQYFLVVIFVRVCKHLQLRKAVQKNSNVNITIDYSIVCLDMNLRDGSNE